MENLLDGYNEESLKFLVTYPHFDQDVFDRRMKELLSLDITALFSFGRVQLHKTCVIGKGSIGLVSLVKYRKKYLVIKIRRTDSNRINMFDEVMYQSLANSNGIGPFIVNFSENFILMEFIKGINISPWFESQKTSIANLLNCTTSVLEQCFRLDSLNLDHGQLSRLDQHIIVSKQGNPTILDFETSSTRRRVSNVTSVFQSIFLHGSIYNVLRDSINNDLSEVIKTVKDYKKDRNRQNFERILSLLHR